MPGPVSLTTLTTRVRRASDTENSQFVTDAEIQEYLSEAVGRLLDIVLESTPAENFATDTADGANATVSGTASYAIKQTASPTYARPYKILAVRVDVGGGRYVPIQPLRAREMGAAAFATWSPQTARYAFNFSPSGTNGYFGANNTAGALEAGLTFYPTPNAATPFRVLYVPYPSLWSTEGASTLFNGLSGWEQWCVMEAACRCMEKAESDSTRLEMRKAKLEEQIRHHAQTRDVSFAPQIMDVCPIGWDEDIDFDIRGIPR